MRRNFAIPAAAGLLILPVAWLLGNRTMAGFIGFSIVTFVLAGIIQEYVRGVRARMHSTSEPLPAALANLVRRNGRRYGGYIVHFGVLLVALGIIGNEFYQSEGQANLRPGESITVANYTLTYRGLNATQGPNYTEFTAPMTLARAGRPAGEIAPKKHIYNKNQDQPMTEVGLRAGLVEDVYAVLAGFEGGGVTASFKVYVNPLMSWMWVGGLVLILGVLVSAWPRRSPTAADARAPAPVEAQPA
jgi:cytochrome c-type biogenesis protein CcmF